MTETPEVMWQGQYIRAMRQGQWEYASRCKAMTAVVIFAEVDGKVLLIEQKRIPIGKRCIELPAGLVGDEDQQATVLGTAAKELAEETGYEAAACEVIGEFYSSPGMIAESFTLVRATGLTKVGDGGGNEHEDIVVHAVPRADISAFIARMRGEGRAIDVRILALADFLGPG
ncbi:MAG: NUDIX hydrolase [Sphingomicrobium sp.]